MIAPAESDRGPIAYKAAVMSLRAMEAPDLDRVSQFLLRSRQLDHEIPFAQTRNLDWKYLYPRSDGTGSRGFMLEKAGRILAFGGLIPARLCLPSGETVGSATVIDWAAEPSAPGAGIALLSKLARKVDTLFVVGGAPATRRILPQIGFRSGGIVRAYSKWVRPWKEFRLRPLVPPSVLRLVHGLMHSFDRKPTSGGWDCVPIREFDPSFRGLLDGLSRPVTFVRRTVEDLNYMLRCPVVEMRGFLLRRRGAIAGYFIFGKAGWEGRIVDLFIDSSGVDDWSLAYAAAAETIGREPEVCRIFAWATQQLGELLEENGFWRQEEKPVLVRDPNNLLARAFPLALQMFDIDAAYFTN